ncbi:MAG: hypothetical protein Q4G54_04010 [Pelistega sp.]|nr:hypothetical protein [Pelistega sp.]
MFLNKITTLAISLPLLLAATGCATTDLSHTYDPKKSKALNIADMGGLVTGIGDADIPKDSTGALTDSTAYAALSGYVGTLTAPTIGVNPLTGGLMGFFSMLATPKSHGARNSFFAFMPASEAGSPDQARVKLKEHLTLSFQKTLVDFNLMDKVIGSNPNAPDDYAIYFEKAEWGCPKYAETKSQLDLCRILIRVNKPALLNNTPQTDWLIKDNQFYYFSGSGDHFYNDVHFSLQKTAKPPTKKMFTQMSKHLPAWVYIYVAPKKSLDDEGKPISFPYLLNQGKMEYFIKP